MNGSEAGRISIREFFSGKTVFLTGATGFVGKGLVEKILHDIPEVRRIYVLIRSKGEDRSGALRFQREIADSGVFGRLRRRHGAGFDEFLMKKVHPVAGDLGEDRLGIREDEYRRLCAEVDIVINSAATVSFDERLDLALSLNTMGAKRLTMFAVDADAEAFVHVSTCYVSGTRSGDCPEALPPIETTPPTIPDYEGPFNLDTQIREIEETCRRIIDESKSDARMTTFRWEAENHIRAGAGIDLDEATEERRRIWLKDTLIKAGVDRARKYGWNETYTYTKSLGEHIVARHRGKVPTSILRPSIIESSYIEPEPGWIDGFRMADPLIAAYGRGTLYDFPGDSKSLLDIIPLDFVCNAILAVAAATPHNRDLTVYQSATGLENPIDIATLYGFVRAYFDRHPMHDEKGLPIRPRVWTFPTVEQFLRHYHWFYRIPLGLLRAFLGPLRDFRPAKEKRKKIDRVLAQVEQILYYSKIYSPYTRRSARYLTDNLKKVCNSLSDDEKGIFIFDPSVIHWERYICEIHIPGLKKHILKMVPGVSLPVEAPLRGLPKTAEETRRTVETIPDLFYRSVYRYPESIALQVKRGASWVRYSYSDTYLLSRHVRHELSQAGIKKGDRVAIWSENRPEWQICYLGLASLGGVGVPLDFQLPVEKVWGFVLRSGAKILLTTPERARLLRREIPQEAGNRGVEIRDISAWGAPFGSSPEPLPAEPEPEVEILPDDLALIIFTSGTTVAPKGVPLTHRNLVSNVLAVSEILSPYETDQFLSLLPLHHAFEFCHGFLTMLFGGATITHLERLNAATILSTMKETGTTVILAVPRLIELFWSRITERVPKHLTFVLQPDEELKGFKRHIAQRIRPVLAKLVHKEFGGHVRLFVSGGAALDGEVWRGFTRLGFTVSEGYGLTETSPVLTVNPVEDSRPGTCGPAIPDVEIKIHEPDDRGIGEVLVRGPNVMKGYLDDPERNAESFIEGWFRTRDLGYLGLDGYLHLSGRRDDVIVTAAGKNVHPDEVEAYYKGLPDVLEYCVVGVQDPKSTGRQIHIVIRPVEEPAGSWDVTTAEISRAVEAASGRIPTHHRVQKIHFWREDLPKTAMLKVKRSAVRKILELETPEAESKGDNMVRRDPVERGVVDAVSRVSKISSGSIQNSDRLQIDLALDSIMRLDLMADLEHRFKTKIMDEEAEKWETVGDVINTLRGKRQ